MVRAKPAWELGKRMGVGVGDDVGESGRRMRN